MSLLRSLTRLFFRSVLFTSHICVDFPASLFSLMTNSIPLWSEKMGGLHLLQFADLFGVCHPVCPGECSTCTRLSVCSAARGWAALLSVKFIWLESDSVPAFACWFSLWAMCPSQSECRSPALLWQFPPTHGFAFHVFLNPFNHSVPFDWHIQSICIR